MHLRLPVNGEDKFDLCFRDILELYPLDPADVYAGELDYRIGLDPFGIIESGL